jgi:DNA-binding response OmpR family regulator
VGNLLTIPQQVPAFLQATTGVQRRLGGAVYWFRHMTKDASRPVLVVEDDVSVRRPLVKFLEMHGFSVVTAETSDEGLDALGKNKFVAAVVDLRLKRGSGRDVVVSTPADVPVIIFSGVPSESAELERLRPRTRLIEKPYSLVLLVETLEEMLSESKTT